MSIGARLKEERERMGMTQEKFSSACGVRRRAQSTYETGDRSPDSLYLAAASRIGVDVGYVLTGQRQGAKRRVPMDLDDFGRAAAAVLGISEQQLLIATETLTSKMDGYGIALDLLSDSDGSNGAYWGIFELELRAVVKALIQEAISGLGDPDSELLGKVLESVDGVIAERGTQLSSNKKAAAVVMLYRAFKASGRVDPATVEEAVTLASA